MENAQKLFEDYLCRYCKLYGINPEEAEKHKIVQAIKTYYEEEYGNRIK